MTLTDSFIVRRDGNDHGSWQVLTGSDRTGGSLIFGEARLPPRSSGPGLHVHTREGQGRCSVSR